MAVPQALLWQRDPHTEAKHRVLRGYLDAWWPILLDRNPRVTYAEGYAGPGEYKDGEDGSPVVALRALLDRDRPVDLGGKTANLVLVEERQDRLAHCRQQISTRLGQVPAEVNVIASVGRCEDELIDALNRTGAFGHPMLVNLDPFSAGVPYEVVVKVARNRSSEVLISLMMSWFSRFAEHENMGQGDRQFGGTEWRQVVDVPSTDKRRWLIDLYGRRLRDPGFSHIVWFELVDEGGRAFALIFGTKSALGLQKMKESFWRVDPVHGINFRDPRDPGQLTFDLDNDPYLTSLKNSLIEHMIGQTDMLVNDLRDWTLENTVFLPKHAMDVLSELKTNRRLAVNGRLQRTSRVRLVDPPEVQTRTERRPEQNSLF